MVHGHMNVTLSLSLSLSLYIYIYIYVFCLNKLRYHIVKHSGMTPIKIQIFGLERHQISNWYLGYSPM